SCEVCNEAEGVIRCKSCIGFHGWCKPCTVKVHKHLPFHQLEIWTGACYEDISLGKLGFVWFLGHDGDLCPLSSDWEDMED
ncbi:hypothetical protein PAXRUDRAFT_121006, partial [Paxillus rubicundulus Ve08.2h10]